MASVEEQIARLRSGLGFAAHLHLWLLTIAVLGLLLAAAFWHPVPLMFAAFFGIVGLSEQQAGPNLQRAILAYDAGTPTQGEVAIRISPGDGTDVYHAVIHEAGHSDWEYEFIPQGWRPVAACYRARIWRAEGDYRPILAVVDQGLLIPRYDPVQRVALTSQGEP